MRILIAIALMFCWAGQANAFEAAFQSDGWSQISFDAAKNLARFFADQRCGNAHARRVSPWFLNDIFVPPHPCHPAGDCGPDPDEGHNYHAQASFVCPGAHAEAATGAPVQAQEIWGTCYFYFNCQGAAIGLGKTASECQAQGGHSLFAPNVGSCFNL